MGLVGDLIVHVRENGPDPASFIGPPTSVSVVDGGAGPGPLPAGTYQVIITAVNQWGESLGTSEQTVGPLAINHQIGVTINTPVVGAVDYRIYVGTSPGAENGFWTATGLGFIFTALNVTGNVTTLSGINPGVPPSRATGMLPDTDGGYVSAYTLYRWLSNALDKGVRIGGGLPLATGVRGIANQGVYRLAGRWMSIEAGWFDGWPMNMGRKGDVFKHNVVTGIPGLQALEQATDSTIVQLWPQANRSGSTTTLSVGMVLTDVVASVVASSNFLSLGMAQIDNEIVMYFGVAGNQLSGLVRGYAGTLIATHSIGAPVTELNLSFTGYGMPVAYGPGDAAKTLPIPPGWDEPLIEYLIARFKKSELSNSEALGIERQFEEAMKKMAKDSRPVKRTAQIGGVGGTETSPGGAGGGIILT